MYVCVHTRGNGLTILTKDPITAWVNEFLSGDRGIAGLAWDTQEQDDAMQELNESSRGLRSVVYRPMSSIGRPTAGTMMMTY